MKKSAYLLLILMASLTLVVACGKKPKVIPESVFAEIYEDMFISDQWMNNHADQRKIADTTWFYDPIFEKYGYNKEDYFASVAFYLKTPDKYAEIFRQTKELIDADIERLGFQLADEMSSKSKVQCVVPLYADIIESLEFRNSINIEFDSTGVFKIKKIDYDTTYSGPRIVVKPAKPEPVAEADTVITDSKVDEPSLQDKVKLSDDNKVSPGRRPRLQEASKL